MEKGDQNAAIIKKSQYERFARKPLDKPHGMWYNEYSQEGETPKGRKQIPMWPQGKTETKPLKDSKNFQRNLKALLTNPQAYGIISM